MPADDASGWDVIVPVKQLAVAKSRLGSYGDALRRALALAFVSDVVTAALHSDAVATLLVVCADDEIVSLAGELGGRAVREQPGAGHDAAVRLGVATTRDSAPGRGVVVLSSDLPALRADELTALLAEVPDGRSALVADEEGTGTTVLAAAPGVPLHASYGRGSRRRHEQAGALLLTGTPGLRRDVDTPVHLAQAAALGVGPATRQVLELLGAAGLVHLDGAP